ncbi:Rab11 family-interacting protein 4A [Orchesella cincta]|uniref:Rab11 family-interacting protein 4A n=1 Tax=Orchesella cincta TaxID=48709 RepID=A0A1D2N371_ORCCI|nr:Rab11 family-interacting protein 4A [Orchesella cincta]
MVIDGTELDLTGSGVGGASTPLSRNSWTRTSLRKSPQNNGEAMGYRRWGSFRNPPGTKRTPPVVTSSNALANQLYRSSSFHSSGRSSAGDAEEMYSDGSLEDEVIDLTHKVHHLEEKMNVLAENQSDADDRYTREKEKNAELSTKVFMLEEQLRETELRGDEKLREEQRRFKEFQSRWDREKQLQSENCEIRLQSMEKDLSAAKTESTRLRNQLDRERSEKDHFSDRCLEMEREIGNLREENRSLQDQGRRDRETMAVESAGAQQALLELKREVESMHQFQMQNSPSSLRRQEESIHADFEFQELKSRLIEREEEVRKLKKQNEHLQDANDELNAQLLNRGLEEGRTLLTTINSVPAGDSLAAEFEAMSQDQNAIGLCVQSEMDLAKVKKALKEQVEVNEQLRAYIDGILLIIVENNPQLLEVKNHSSGSRNSSSNNNLNDKCHQAQPMTNGVTKIV